MNPLAGGAAAECRATPAAVGSFGGGVLVLRGGALGDFLLTLPAVRALRRAFSSERIEVVGSVVFGSIALRWGLVDAARRLEDAGLATFFSRGSDLDARWASYFASFRVVISYLSDPDGSFHENLCRAGVRSLIRGPSKPLESEGPAARQLAAPLDSLGITLSPDELGEPFCPWVPGARIALHPGSGSPHKSWAAANWVTVAADLQRRFQCQLMVVAGEAESGRLPEFLRRLEAAGVDHDVLDSRPLPELADHLAGCRIFLGHDTGPAHLASACGVPCLLLFGPTDPAVWAPPGPRVRVLRAPDHCLSSLEIGTIITAASAMLADTLSP